ncbi:MAG: hypothetical protein NTZ58_05705 [Solirubrobacterales bacterium]|nr:hypothetical protein [Solirubrobacterales bacterium]
MSVAPDLVAVTRAFAGRSARFVVIGGMAVIAHNVVRTTRCCWRSRIWAQFRAIIFP